MPILRAHAKELAGKGCRSSAAHAAAAWSPVRCKGSRHHEKVYPAWGYFKKFCAGHDLPDLLAAPLTVALYLLSLTQTSKSFATFKHFHSDMQLSLVVQH